MAMRQASVRFAAPTHDAIATQAQKLGISAGQYIREAAMMRLAYERGTTGDECVDELRALIAAERAG